MTSWPILSILLILPLVGALFIALLPEDAAGVRNARWMALWTTAITFIVSLILIWPLGAEAAESSDRTLTAPTRKLALVPPARLPR